MATVQAKSIPKLIQQRLVRDHVLRTQIVPCAVSPVVERDSELAEVTQSIACLLRLGEEFHLGGDGANTGVSWLAPPRWCSSRPPMSAQKKPPPSRANTDSTAPHVPAPQEAFPHDCSRHSRNKHERRQTRRDAEPSKNNPPGKHPPVAPCANIQGRPTASNAALASDSNGEPRRQSMTI
jgi:hypothetical protein